MTDITAGTGTPSNDAGEPNKTDASSAPSSTPEGQPTTPEVKAPEAKAEAAEQVPIYQLAHPSGKTWQTTSKAEANQLMRTRGYHLVAAM